MDKEHEGIITYLKKDNGKYLREKLGLVIYDKDERNEPEIVSTIKIKDIEIPVINPLDGSPYEPDITCFDEKDNSIVIVEVKSSEVANHKTFGQILYYLTIANRIRYANGKEVKKNSVKGIVVAREIHGSLRTLVKVYEREIPKINLKYYRRTNGGDYNFYDARLGRLRKK